MAMDVLPGAAELVQMNRERLLDALNLPALESIILNNGHRSCRASESEHRFTTLSNDADVSGPMVIEINNHAESAKPQDSWY